MLNLAAFASGRGSNFQAILRRLQERSLPARYVLLVSDQPRPPVSNLALEAGIPFLCLKLEAFTTPEKYSARLVAELERYRVDWITLAGYLSKLSAEVVQRYPHRILNVHPALLPEFGGKGMYGLNVHRAVLAAGAQLSGATVHFVDEEYDHGTIILQEKVAVLAGDTPETLAARVLEVEHRIYPQVVEWAVLGKLKVVPEKVEIVR